MKAKEGGNCRHGLFDTNEKELAGEQTEVVINYDYSGRDYFAGEYNSILMSPYGYLITLSARYSTDCGIVRPICLAVLKLMMNSNFVGCSTGKSAGFVPLRILST